MQKRLISLAMMVAFCLGLSVGPVLAADILGARIGLRTDATRFVIDLSGKAEFAIAERKSNERIVIDLPQSKLAKGGKLPKRGNGLIKHAMVVGQGKSASQVILFLKKPAVVKRSFRLPARDGKPYRVVIDLAPQ